MSRCWRGRLEVDVSKGISSKDIRVVVDIQTMTVPSARLLLAPLLRIRETVPEVVGFHCRAKGLPAVAEMPSVGILKGLAVLSARARNGAPRTARKTARENNIIMYKCLVD
jgi:hypothetical protein